MKQLTAQILIKFFSYTGTTAGHILGKLNHEARSEFIKDIDWIKEKTPRKLYFLVYALFFNLVKNMVGKEDLYITTRIGSNFKMRLNVSQKTQRLIWLLKPYEVSITRFIENNLKTGEAFFDIGANVGYYSLLSSVIVGESGGVYAFEPEFSNFKSLKTNIELNGFKNINLVNAAVGDTDGETTLHLNPLNEGGHSLNEHSTYHDSGIEVSESEIKRRFPEINLSQKVSIISLESFLSKNPSIKYISLVKIDVEGFELGVIKGMEKLLQTKLIQSIICEVSDADSSVISILGSYGYNPYSIDQDGHITLLKTGIIEGNNYLFKLHE